MATGLQEAFKLEAIYASAPVPRNPAVLTVMSVVFDKIHFPNVYLPKEFDKEAFQREIDRIENALGSKASADDTLGIMRFAQVAEPFREICIFDGDKEEPFKSTEDIPKEFVREIYDVIHGPQRPGWEPAFSPWFHKGVVGKEEHITYPGIYHYMAGAIIRSKNSGIPILNDVSALRLPFISEGPANDAKMLSALIAMECVKLALPVISSAMRT